jgi:hypothetical protein
MLQCAEWPCKSGRIIRKFGDMSIRIAVYAAKWFLMTVVAAALFAMNFYGRCHTPVCATLPEPQTVFFDHGWPVTFCTRWEMTYIGIGARRAICREERWPTELLFGDTLATRSFNGYAAMLDLVVAIAIIVLAGCLVERLMLPREERRKPSEVAAIQPDQ